MNIRGIVLAVVARAYFNGAPYLGFTGHHGGIHRARRERRSADQEANEHPSGHAEREQVASEHPRVRTDANEHPGVQTETFQ